MKLYILEQIKKILEESINGKYEVEGARYHHNTEYSKVSSILNHGLLSINQLNNKKIRELSDKKLFLLADTDSHINGVDGISLSVVGLDDLYRDELEYYPYDKKFVDLLIDSDIKTCRKTGHYGNEFIAKDIIKNSNIKSIDIRLIEYINSLDSTNLTNEDVRNIISRFKELKEMIYEIKKLNLNIVVRENSYNNNNLIDINKLVKKLN